MSTDFIKRDETWKPYNFSSNFIVNPFWGAIQVIVKPTELGIFECVKGDNWSIHPLYANYNWVESKGSIQEFIYKNINSETPLITNVTYSSNGDPKSCFYLHQKIEKIENILDEFNEYSKNWKDLNLKNNVPIIFKYPHWEAIKENEESSVLKIILKKYNGFQLVIDNKNPDHNLLYIYNNGNVYSYGNDNNLLLTTISGEESLFVSDKNSSTWNISFNEAFEKLPTLDDEEDICSVFDKNINFIPDEFVFKPLLDHYPYVPYGGASGNQENGFYFASVNFSYSDDYPKITIEEVAPVSECHDLSFEVGSPYVQEGVYAIPVLIWFKKDFSNSAIKNKFIDGEKEYSLFDNTSFIQVKATCESEDGIYKKECFVFFNSDYKLKSTTTITLSIDDSDEEEFKFMEGEMIDLPTMNENGSAVFAYWSEKDYSIYKNNYKVIKNDQLKGYSWNKVLSKGKKYSEETFIDDNVSGFPLLYNNNLIFFNKNNSKICKYEQSGIWTGDWIVDKSEELINNNYYFISKIVDVNHSYEIKNKILNKVIAFGYNEDKTNKISIFDHDFNFKNDLKLLNIEKGCFLLPFGNAICSSRNNNIVKLLVLKTISNDFINKDNSYYDVFKYKASIGNICSIEIDLDYNTANIKTIKEIPEDDQVNGNKCTCYFPSTSGFNFIRNGEKSYVNMLLNADFDNEIELVEFNNRHKTDLWCFKCKKATIKHEFTTREVIVEEELGDTILFLSSDTRNNQSINEYSGDFFSVLKVDNEDKAYFIHNNDIKIFDGSSLVISDIKSSSYPKKLFYFENKKIKDSNIYEGTDRIVCYINKNGIFNINSDDAFISHPNSFGNVKHVDLSGVSENSNNNANDTDCTFIYDNIIWPCYQNEEYLINGLTGVFVSSKVINGLLFTLQKDKNNILKIFNFGGVHPKY